MKGEKLLNKAFHPCFIYNRYFHACQEQAAYRLSLIHIYSQLTNCELIGENKDSAHNIYDTLG